MGRSNFTGVLLEQLETRAVPAAHPALSLVALDVGVDQPASQDMPATAAFAAFGSTHGAAGQMPAFYDGELFIVNMMEMPHSDPLTDHNSAVNTIYATNDLDDEQDFNPVIDAIHGDGFNALWRQVLIHFNQGFTPHQFTSDEQVIAASHGPNPEITLVVTDEVYRCSVVGAGNTA